MELFQVYEKCRLHYCGEKLSQLDDGRYLADIIPDFPEKLDGYIIESVEILMKYMNTIPIENRKGMFIEFLKYVYSFNFEYYMKLASPYEKVMLSRLSEYEKEKIASKNKDKHEKILTNIDKLMYYEKRDDIELYNYRCPEMKSNLDWIICEPSEYIQLYARLPNDSIVYSQLLSRKSFEKNYGKDKADELFNDILALSEKDDKIRVIDNKLKMVFIPAGSLKELMKLQRKYYKYEYYMLTRYFVEYTVDEHGLLLYNAFLMTI